MRNGSKAWRLRPVGRMSRVADQVAARHRPDEPAVERAQQRRRSRVLGQQLLGDASARGRRPRLGHRREHARRSPRASGGRPTTCRPSGISAFSVSSSVAPQPVRDRSAAGRGRPPRPAPGSAWRDRAPVGRRRGQAAPAVEAVLQLQQALVEPGLRQRRRQVADHRRARCGAWPACPRTGCWRRRGRRSAGRRSAGRASRRRSRPVCLPGMNSSAPCMPKCSSTSARKSCASQR